LTVALFHSRVSRSAFAGSGGPSAPDCGFSKSAVLFPAFASSARRSVIEAPAAAEPAEPCIAATLSRRDKKPPPTSPRPVPFTNPRRPSFIDVLSLGALRPSAFRDLPNGPLPQHRRHLAAVLGRGAEVVGRLDLLPHRLHGPAERIIPSAHQDVLGLARADDGGGRGADRDPHPVGPPVSERHAHGHRDL